MHMLVAAAASALLGATLLTELTTRLWPDSRVALLITSAVILFLTALLNARLARTARANQGESVPVRRERPASRSASRSGSRSESRSESPSTPTRDTPREAGGTRESGTVKWFNRTKGFGFIVRPDGSEIFVHQRSIRLIDEGDSRRRPALLDGQQVTFTVAVRDKGPQAEDVFPDSER